MFLGAPTDPSQRKAALDRLGLHPIVVGVLGPRDRFAAFSGCPASPVPDDPSALALHLDAASEALGLLRGASAFAISILDGDCGPRLCEIFSTPRRSDEGAFSGIPIEIFGTGAPVLAAALAYLECLPEAFEARGDQVRVVGRIAGAQLRPDRGKTAPGPGIG